MQFTLIAVIAGLGGLLFGYDTGVISGALLFIRHVFHLGPTMQGVVVAIALAAAAVGAAFAGSLSDSFGRRIILLITALIFIVGALVSAVAWSVAILLLGRVLVGAAIGVASMLTPMYLSEISPPEKRGAIVTINQFYITLGIVVSYGVGFLLSHGGNGWRWMLGLGAVPGVVLFAGMLTLPESPRWLAGKRREDAARRALIFLRGREDVTDELSALRQDIAREDRATAPWSVLFEKRARRPLIVGIGLAIFQQVTGINTVIYFAPTIFLKAGLPSASVSILATAGVGVVNVVMTLVAMRLLDVAGRRKLLLWGLAGMLVTLVILSVSFMIGLHGSLALVTVLSVAAYVAFFAIGLGPVFWLLIAEIFPLAVRGRGMSLATISNWTFNMLVSITFLDLVHGFGRGPTFLIYAAMTLATIVFTWFLVPETKGRSLEEIEAALEGEEKLAA
ncbi:sugar porter family MFS transporter [Acidiphilium sp. AL]|uniref:Sugar porter family MFS transporter n=1 Tax=Acidiphilium iwatense TaxID=768198 RepID=A0ABS9DUZ2_9PROT|nr:MULTISPECIES: sugar porter family MFS transporter [Acidiphilium]MCF3946549.1 sugar porter family MFS transporter [Acidiphilium iwatense]MCU4160270.1 sugar porter family MFS transporter [Acidiphilium sp. AL]